MLNPGVTLVNLLSSVFAHPAVRSTIKSIVKLLVQRAIKFLLASSRIVKPRSNEKETKEMFIQKKYSSPTDRRDKVRTSGISSFIMSS